MLNKRCKAEFGRSGFTFIELLVSIAIVLILVALVFSGGGNAIRAVDTVKCSANMCQLGLAFSHYIADNDGKFPDSPFVSGATWDMQIMPYLDTSGYNYPSVSPFVGLDTAVPSNAAKLFKCPADKGKRLSTNYPRSYSCVAWIDNYLLSYSGLLPVNIGIRHVLIKSPSKSAVLVENPAPAPNGTTGNVLGYISFYTYPVSYAWSNIHSDKSNILFADWHVEQVLKSRTDGTLFNKYFPAESDWAQSY